MITFVVHRECEVSHAALWDDFLTMILDEESKDLIMSHGIGHVVKEMKQGNQGRFIISLGSIRCCR